LQSFEFLLNSRYLVYMFYLKILKLNNLFPEVKEKICRVPSKK
jgi:hypothetical protein